MSDFIRNALQSEAEQQALFEAHASWARGVAMRWMKQRGLIRGTERDIVINSALIGLWKAVQRFRPLDGTPFRGFAFPCVLGGMIDGARKDDCLSRNERRDHSVQLLSVDFRYGCEGADHSTFGELILRAAPDDFKAVDDRDECAVLLSRAQLTEREDLVLRRTFVNGDSFVDVAKLLRVTPSRIGQIYRIALNKLWRWTRRAG